MALTEQTLDVHFTPVNQQAPKTTSPTGRLAHMVNAVANQFEGQNLRTAQRGGFRQLSKKVIDLDTKTVTTATAGFPATPDLFSSLGDQLVIVSDSKPYVYADRSDEWSNYEYVLHANSPRQIPIYTSNVQIKCVDSAIVNDVICYVWKEKSPANITNCFVMIKDRNGTVVLERSNLIQADDTQVCQVKVVSDGARFWVFYSGGSASASGGSMLCNVYLTDGTQSGFSSFTTLDGNSDGAGWWDVQFNKLGVVWFGQKDTVNKALYHFSWSAGTITPALHNFDGFGLPTIIRQWWLTNPYDNTHAYLGVLTQGDGTNDIYVMAFPSVTTYDRFVHAQSVADFTLICEVSGFRDANGLLDVLRSDLGAADSVFNLTTRTEIALDDSTVDTVMNSVTVASRTFFLNNRPTSIMYFNDDVQPTYFLHDLISNQVCGMWDHGSAAQDWQGTPGVVGQAKNHDAYCVPSPYVDLDGNFHCAVAFLAESFSRNFITFTRTGSNPITSIVTSKFVSTVGLADIEWSKAGRATEYADELMIPGTNATAFTGALFTEDNFHLFPSPFTISQSHSDAGNLEENAIYSIVVVFESTDTRGNRIKSRPSDPIEVTLTGTNNLITIDGPTLFETFGKTNVMISVYSTYPTAGVPSNDHRKVTDDLIPVLNDKGSLTWEFILNKTTEDIQVGEVLYTDNGLLAHDPCPAHNTGCIAGNRMIVAGYDGALWYSDEKVEGEPLIFHIDSRVLMPTSEKAWSMNTLDSMRVIISCEKSHWEFDISQMPGPDGQNGNIQSPKRLPFNNGAIGQAELIKEGVAYPSSAGGIWLVSRGLENMQLSAPEYDGFLGQEIAGISTDDRQRTIFGLLKTENFKSIVRDGINGAWYEFNHPRKIVLIHKYKGGFAYCDDISVHYQDETPYDTFLDDGTQAVTNVAIIQDITTDSMNFGNVKGIKCVWRFLLYGEVLGEHNIILDASYETEDGTITESWTVPWATITAYYPLIELSFEPKVIEMSSIVLRIRSDYNVPGLDTGAKSFELETVSFEIGVDSYLNRTPVSRSPSST
jgi:hypothetical protein